MNKNQNNKIIKAFLNSKLYNHSVDRIELVETHISWVFLTGSFAYKIKKPVSFDFLDFSSLERRQFFCEQELRLNRRFAPDIYLEVLPITQSDNTIHLAGQGEIIEYVIKMKQFDQNCLLDKLLQNKQIELNHIDNLSDVITEFHEKINIADSSVNFGSFKEVIKPIEENFSILNHILDDSLIEPFVEKNEQQKLNDLHTQLQTMYQFIRPKIISRKKEGHIRECHGDLHLGNISLIKNKVLLFDGIEFNDSFRWIDTMSDCAFLIMDLQDHKQTIFANHFLNRYLSKSGDYSGLYVLKFYLIYRATIKAKVAALRLQQQIGESTTYKNSISDLKNYLQLAESYVPTHGQINRSFLTISFGLSGSGKSWVCSQLADQSGAIHISSDVERKRCFSTVVKDLYSESTTHQTYTHLLIIGELILNAGYSLIVDATFLDQQWRQKFRRLAQKHRISFHILNCYADQKTIIKRLNKRKNDINNISDADSTIMKKQLNNRSSLGLEEKIYEIPVNTEETLDYSSIMTQIQKECKLI